MDIKATKGQLLSVLIVEDDEDLRSTLIALLESLDLFRFVLGAIDGKEAIMKISNQKFDLVLTDLKLPRVNGFELASHIQRVKSKENIKVILMSGELTTEDVLKTKELGICAVLAKPFRLEKFKEELLKTKLVRIKD